MLKESDNIFNDNFVDEVYDALVKIEPFSALSYEDLNRLKNVIWLYIDKLYNKKFIKSMDRVTSNVENYINTTLRDNIIAEYDEKLKKYSRQLSDNIIKYINDYYTAEEKIEFEIPNTIINRDREDIEDYVERVLNKMPGSVSNIYFDRAVSYIQNKNRVEDTSLIDKINKFNNKK